MARVLTMKPNQERLQKDILWGMFSVLEYIVEEMTNDMGKLSQPMINRMDEIRSALIELES